MADTDDLNAMVTNAIVAAERDGKRESWAAVCAIEQALAIAREGTEKEIGQRGAVSAAVKAGLPMLAEHLRAQYEAKPSPMPLALIDVTPRTYQESPCFVDSSVEDEDVGGVEMLRLPIYPEVNQEKGRKLRAARLDAGASIGQAARAFGVSVVQWSELERGAKDLSDMHWDYVHTCFGKGTTRVDVPFAPRFVYELECFGDNVCSKCKAENKVGNVVRALGYPPMQCDKCRNLFGMGSDPHGWESPLRPSVCRLCAHQHGLCALCGKVCP